MKLTNGLFLFVIAMLLATLIRTAAPYAEIQAPTRETLQFTALIAMALFIVMVVQKWK